MNQKLDRRALLFGGALAGSALPVVFARDALGQDSRTIEFKESKYNSIYILREGGLIGMIFGVNKQLFTESLYNPADPRELPVVYTRYMTAALAYPATLASVLEIGLGGGRTASYLSRHMGGALDITCVELDPEVIRMAKKYFGVAETPNMRLVAKDGRSFLRETDKTYDLIMVDAYRGTFVPFHLLTKEFFQLLKTRLKPGGVTAQNIEPTTMLYDSALATLKAVFEQVEIYEADGNVVAIAYDGPVKAGSELSARMSTLQAKYEFRHPLPDLLDRRRIVTAANAKVLTDDFAPVEALKATERYNKKRSN
ncbi:MAG TPA: fused MFS/spermidine synthase [Caulobacterales bacterium]|nr:fused MFS/spermidine synthase [Caulobacterales bacterium]